MQLRLNLLALWVVAGLIGVAVHPLIAVCGVLAGLLLVPAVREDRAVWETFSAVGNLDVALHRDRALVERVVAERTHRGESGRRVTHHWASQVRSHLTEAA
ncbi:MAG: hypothetical protein U5R31_15330 [Acidimicrobiia bacterium]|nr:hypothetical protein [Acidimicrobiia bacterium]